jgi:SPOR domain
VRNAFFALLLVNLAYFAWAHWVDAPRPPPVNEPTTKLPRLKLVEGLPPSPPPAGAAEKTVLNQAAACFSVGPFADVAKSAQAATLLREKGFDPRQRAHAGRTSEGYWVLVNGMKTRAETDRAMATLEKSGIKDALVMAETPEAGRRLSLGIYSERSRAERRAQAIRQIGLNAEVAERTVPGIEYWVDLTASPGMSTLPIQDLFAEGVSSRIAVAPCPAAGQATAGAPAAESSPPPPARTATPHATKMAGTPKLP